MEQRSKENYRKEILQKYHLEKKGELSPYFFEPTPGLIKEACIVVFDKRGSKEDIKILRNFFKPEKEEHILNSIQKIDIDKFRPIVKFLKEGKTTPKGSSLELASWLVDFKPRPFIRYIQWSGREEEREEYGDDNISKNQSFKVIDFKEGKKVQEEDRLDEIEKEKEKKKKKRRWMVTISTSIAFATILMTIPLLKDLISEYSTPRLSENCMTWADSVYIAVSCDLGPFSKDGNPIKPMNRYEFKNMQKVEVNAAYSFFSEDGKPLIWYYKNRDSEFEYFTAPGLHPTTGETLRKITPYIIQTYVPFHNDYNESVIK